MNNIAVCDDNKAICAQIENILLSFSKSVGLKVEVSIFYTGEVLLEFIKQGNSFDMIFLDIEMEKINGIEVGKQLRKDFNDYTTEIIYVSGNEGYDRQLFDVQPLHFIPKPINESLVIDDFKLALKRSQRGNVFFKYQKGYDVFQIPVDEIIYFESSNREIRIVTIKGEDCFYGSLEGVQLRILGDQFLNIHRSYLINYNHVSIARYSEVVMSNDVVLPISRVNRTKFRELHFNQE